MNKSEWKQHCTIDVHFTTNAPANACVSHHRLQTYFCWWSVDMHSYWNWSLLIWLEKRLIGFDFYFYLRRGIHMAFAMGGLFHLYFSDWSVSALLNRVGIVQNNLDSLTWIQWQCISLWSNYSLSQLSLPFAESHAACGFKYSLVVSCILYGGQNLQLDETQ